MSNTLKNNTYLSKLTKKELQALLLYLENYQIAYKDSLGFPESLSFGIEVEFSNAPLALVRNLVQNTPPLKGYLPMTDISVCEIKDNLEIGGEVSTSIMHDTKEEWQNLCTLLTLLKSLNATITDKCSTHIHIGSQILGYGPENILRFLKVWTVFENIIYKFSINGTFPRSGILEYASPIRPLYNAKGFRYSSLRNLCFDKSKGLNLKNYYPTKEEEVNNTLEIRTPNGTLNPIVIENNVNFFLSLLNFATSNLYDDTIFDDILKKGLPQDFSSYFQINLRQALILADLIYSTLEAKLDFLKVYLKDSNYPNISLK